MLAVVGMGGDRDGEQEMSTIGMLPGSIQLQSGSPGAHHMMRGENNVSYNIDKRDPQLTNEMTCWDTNQ